MGYCSTCTSCDCGCCDSTVPIAILANLFERSDSVFLWTVSLTVYARSLAGNVCWKGSICYSVQICVLSVREGAMSVDSALMWYQPCCWWNMTKVDVCSVTRKGWCVCVRARCVDVLCMYVADACSTHVCTHMMGFYLTCYLWLCTNWLSLTFKHKRS